MLAFQFVDPGPLWDDDLELVPLDARWVDHVVRAANHPMTRKYAPGDANVTRSQLNSTLQSWPGGRQPGDPENGIAPAYHFWMKVTVPRPVRPPLFGGRTGRRFAIAGGIAMRIGHSDDIERYYGHVGYHVYPPSRGHHYAERAVRLLLPLAQHHGMNPLWITTNPDNLASRRTCERLGAEFVETLEVPQGHPLYLRGERRKCRYRLFV
jgi:hypothetical protein